MPSALGGLLTDLNHPFSALEYERYDRHLKLAVMGVEGQKKLRAGRVLCVGVGGLGSAASLYLAAAGVGTLGLVDDDRVSLSNLQRQILYRVDDVHQLKVARANASLTALNPDLTIIAYAQRLTAENAEAIITAYDLVIDGSDNFATHYLVNAVCQRLEKPSIFAAVSRTQGHCSLFNAKNGPCYACLFPENAALQHGDTCSEAGVLGVLPGLLGIIQATEAIKWLAQIGEPLINRLLSVDMLSLRFQEYRLEKNPDCEVCSHSKRSSPFDSIEKVASMHSISVKELQTLQIEQSADICLLDVRNPDEYALGNLGGQLIPLSELPHRLSEISKTKHLIVHCRSGARSAQAVQVLMDAGFSAVSNLRGGILAWAEQIDPSLRV